jgi:hypothetical protein
LLRLTRPATEPRIDEAKLRERILVNTAIVTDRASDYELDFGWEVERDCKGCGALTPIHEKANPGDMSGNVSGFLG